MFDVCDPPIPHIDRGRWSCSHPSSLRSIRSAVAIAHCGSLPRCRDEPASSCSWHWCRRGFDAGPDEWELDRHARAHDIEQWTPVVLADRDPGHALTSYVADRPGSAGDGHQRQEPDLPAQAGQCQRISTSPPQLADPSRRPKGHGLVEPRRRHARRRCRLLAARRADDPGGQRVDRIIHCHPPVARPGARHRLHGPAPRARRDGLRRHDPARAWPRAASLQSSTLPMATPSEHSTTSPAPPARRYWRRPRRPGRRADHWRSTTRHLVRHAPLPVLVVPVFTAD